jgi:hypothetical protein
MEAVRGGDATKPLTPRPAAKVAEQAPIVRVGGEFVDARDGGSRRWGDRGKAWVAVDRWRGRFEEVGGKASRERRRPWVVVAGGLAGGGRGGDGGRQRWWWRERGRKSMADDGGGSREKMRGRKKEGVLGAAH